MFDFDRLKVGVALREGNDVVGVSTPEALIADVSRRAGLSVAVGLTVVVVDADEGSTVSAPAPALFKARYER